MQPIPRSILEKAQSAAWIAPNGEFIPVPDAMMHSDIAEFFAGMPRNEDYPANYAVEKLGYVKAGNAFDFSLYGEIRHTNEKDQKVDRDKQFDMMAQFTAQAVIHFVRSRLPVWFNPSRDDVDDPEKWKVHFVDTSRGSVEKMSVKKFMRSKASDETRVWFDMQMRRINEEIVRNHVRSIISELMLTSK